MLFRIRAGVPVAIYDGRTPAQFYKRLFKTDDVRFERASHINPTPDGQAFQIDWVLPAMIAQYGAVQRATTEGIPFLTKAEAEQEEVRLLRLNGF